MASSKKAFNSTMKIISANIRGFRTNVGELTHSFIIKTNADIVFTSETFLDSQVAPNFATIPGYTPWHRRDRNEDGGGVALCHKVETRLQVLDEEVPEHLELILFRFFDASGDATLVFGCYRPPTQGIDLFNFINDHLDSFTEKIQL